MKAMETKYWLLAIYVTYEDQTNGTDISALL